MGIEKTPGSGWTEWQGFLINAYESGAAAFQGKGAASLRNSFTALFLQNKGFGEPSSAVLTKAVSVLRGEVINDSRYDILAMAGHRIGMVTNTAEVKQYLKDLHIILKPAGSILFTSIKAGINSASAKRTYEEETGVIQLQHENLIGPYFCTFRIDSDILKIQAIASNWQCDFIHHQDNDNYIALLRMS